MDPHYCVYIILAMASYCKQRHLLLFYGNKKILKAFQILTYWRMIVLFESEKKI